MSVILSILVTIIQAKLNLQQHPPLNKWDSVRHTGATRFTALSTSSGDMSRYRYLLWCFSASLTRVDRQAVATTTTSYSQGCQYGGRDGSGSHFRLSGGFSFRIFFSLSHKGVVQHTWLERILLLFTPNCMHMTHTFLQDSLTKDI